MSNRPVRWLFGPYEDATMAEDQVMAHSLPSVPLNLGPLNLGLPHPREVVGMGLFADGGEMATEPYAAGGAYLNRMANSCRGCRYRPSVRVGPQANTGNLVVSVVGSGCAESGSGQVAFGGSFH